MSDNAKLLSRDEFGSQNDRKNQIKKFFANPMSSFIVTCGLLLFLQIIAILGNETGVQIIKTSTMSALGITLIYSMIAIGFCLLLGYSGLASLGTAGFVGIGSYLAYFCFEAWGLPYFVCFFLTLVISVLIGLAVGFISLRIEGIYLAIITLGLAEILRNAMQAIKATINISLKNIKLFGVSVPKTVVFCLITVTFLILVWVTSNLIRSPTGRAMLAMKNSTAAAQAYGISLMKYRLMAFVISTCYAAIAGIMYMMYIRSISTSMANIFKLATSLNILAAVIIGGAKSIWGAVGGTVIIYGLDALVLQNIKFFRDNPTFISIFIGILLIVVVMFYPGGIAQAALEIKIRIKAKIKAARAKKYGNDI